MKQKRAERIMEALKEMGLRQMLIVDPMSIYYLTGEIGRASCRERVSSPV